MAEPQPSTVREGADIEDEAPVAPKSAEDRKAAAALSTLSAHDDESSASKPEVDTKALGDAMSRLDMTGKTKGDEEKKKKEEEGVVKKKVKVDQGDVALLVEELELSKVKATELLRAHEGDAVKAIKAFITPSVVKASA